MCWLIRLLTPPIRFHLLPDKRNTPGKLIHTVHAIFYADPSVKSNAFEFRENRIIVIQAFTDLSMTKSLSISNGTSLLLSQVFNGSHFQITIAGMHRNHTIRYTIQQLQRIFSCQIRVAGIIINAESRMVYAPDKLAKHIHLLCKLRILPEIIFIVILQYQRYVSLFSIGQTFFNQSAASFTPSSIESSGRRCPESTRQNDPPSVCVMSIHRFCLEISFDRNAASGCVKSGEQHIMGITFPKSSTWRRNNGQLDSFSISRNPAYHSRPSISNAEAS